MLPGATEQRSADVLFRLVENTLRQRCGRADKLLRSWIARCQACE